MYSNVFPEIYCSTERRGFDLKRHFHIIFKTYKDKKNLEAYLGKKPIIMSVFRMKHVFMNKNQ